MVNGRPDLDVSLGSGWGVNSAALNGRNLLDMDASSVWFTVNAP